MTDITSITPQLFQLFKFLGWPGILILVGLSSWTGLLVMLMWYLDQRRISYILQRYREDVDQVKTFYEKNVELVKNYEKLSNDLANIIYLNTQAQTRLVDQITNNMYPASRVKG